MRPVAMFLVACEVVLGLGFPFCSPPPAPQVSGPLGVVRFPQYPWIKVEDGRKWGVNDNTHYVVRRSSSGSGGELLFAVKQGWTGELPGKEADDFPVNNPNYSYYSDTRYAVSLDGGFRVREANIAEWDAAEKVLHSYHFIDTFENSQVTEEGVKYNNRLYRKTGESWGNQAALVSPRGTWIAVFSYASREKPPKPLIIGLGGTEPVRGEVFLDLYDTSSGEKVIAARAPYGVRGGAVSPSVLFDLSLWVEDRYFIMPLHRELDDCFIGILPEK